MNTVEKDLLFKVIGSAEKLSESSLDEISLIVHRSFPKAQWNGKQNYKDAKRELEVCRKLKIFWLKHTDAEYPCMLKTITNHPYMIFYRGSLEAFRQKSVSVVGTRKLSPKGKNAAFQFAKDAALNGVAVISGLANGADGYAHRGAVDAFFDEDVKIDSANLGRTVAVLPSSIDSIVPVSHVKLAENIIKRGGCLISEYAPMTPCASWHFVQRNRIIAALSPATVVIEAPNGSGALITVDFALELGRDVMFHESSFCDLAKKK